MSTVIEPIQTLTLNAEESAAFADAILNPPDPNEEIETAAANYYDSITPEERAENLALQEASMQALGREESDTESEQAPYPADPTQSSQVANIPAIDRQVDPSTPRQPVDVQIVTSRILNPA